MMRALTLTQPWAGLVASGIKLIENRPRQMIKASNWGEPFALHAGREIDEGLVTSSKRFAHSSWSVRRERERGTNPRAWALHPPLEGRRLVDRVGRCPAQRRTLVRTGELDVALDDGHRERELAVGRACRAHRYIGDRMNDIEKARRDRDERALHEGAVEARVIATKLVEGMSGNVPALELAVECQAFMIAALAVCDACGTSREQAIELFSNLAKGLSFPAAVFE
jgi:hypothetical protein